MHISCAFDKKQSLIAKIKPVAQDDADLPPGTIAVLIDPANRIAGGKVAGVSVLGELAARLVAERAEQRAFLQ